MRKKGKRKKLVALISGGIDSPVAVYLMLRQGAELTAVHFDARPFVGPWALEKTQRLVRHLAKKSGAQIKFYVVPYGEIIQKELLKKVPRSLRCVVCRRMMYRIAEAVAKKEGALGLVTGESLGQVASQTLDNIFCEDAAIKMPVHRPLVGFDKEETIALAKKISTYTISIGPGQCCGVIPRYPETHARLEQVRQAEKNLPVAALTKKAIRSARTYNIK